MMTRDRTDAPPKTALFRQEVVDAQRGDWMGAVLLAAPPQRWVVATWSVALALGIIALLFGGHYTRRETVAGVIAPDAGLLNAVAPSAGSLLKVDVHVGQRVRAGDVLVVISGDRDSAALGPLSSRLATELEQQKSSLISDLDNQLSMSAGKRAELDQRITSIQNQLANLDDQLHLQMQLVNSNRRLFERIRPMADKGYVSSVQLLQQETALIDAEASQRGLSRQRLALMQQMDAAFRERSQLPMQNVAARNETDRQLSAVAQAMTRNEVDRAVALRAPQDGVISAILMKQGQSVTAGQAVLTLLPSNAVLEAQLLVPSRAIGFVSQGNRVVLRYEAFPYQKFGLQYGRVREVSRSTLSPSEIGATTATSASQPMYSVLVRLDSQSIAVGQKREPLLPGMAVDAEIMMEPRRLIEWVFEPLYGASQRISSPDH